MTEPNRVIPGETIHIVRCTTQQQYLTLPGEETRELMGYQFARAARITGQKVHGACLMSNHIHTTQTDQHGTRGKFMQRAFAQFARKRNIQLGRSENLWSTDEPEPQVILDFEAMVRMLLYTWLQPVAAGCVDKVEDWTGFMVLPKHWGKPMTFEKPASSGRSLPDVESFVPQVPPGFEEYPLEFVVAFFEDLIRQAEDYFRRRRKRPVLGIEACESMSPWTTPRTVRQRNQRIPRFAASDKSRVRRALAVLRNFRSQHRASRKRMAAGETDVVFPAGTVQMARRAGVMTRSFEEDDPHLMRKRWSNEMVSRVVSFGYRYMPAV